MYSEQSAGAEFVWIICFFFGFFLISNRFCIRLLKTKCLCYAYFWLSNWGRTPTNQFCSLGFVWECPFVNVISPGMTFYVSIYTQRAMYGSVCIHFSAVAPFPASLCSHESLAKRLVQQYTTSLIVFSDEYFALFSSWWINDKTQCSANQKFSNDFGLLGVGSDIATMIIWSPCIVFKTLVWPGIGITSI